MECPHCQGTGQLASVSFGDVVAGHRRKLGLTQAELAIMCGVSRAQIANVETSRADVSIHVLQKLAVALKCEIGDLFPKGA